MRISRERYERGLSYRQFRSEADNNQGLWNGVYEHTNIPGEALRRLQDLPGKRHVLVLVEDWCGDAASLVPILARMADATEQMDLRVLKRDENLDIMDAHLTHGGRAIPLAIVYDGDMQQIGIWGPRPAPAQAMFREKLHRYQNGELEDKKAEVNRPVLRWYREDRGRHTVEEMLNVLERGGELRE